MASPAPSPASLQRRHPPGQVQVVVGCYWMQPSTWDDSDESCKKLWGERDWRQSQLQSQSRLQSLLTCQFPLSFIRLSRILCHFPSSDFLTFSAPPPFFHFVAPNRFRLTLHIGQWNWNQQLCRPHRNTWIIWAVTLQSPPFPHPMKITYIVKLPELSPHVHTNDAGQLWAWESDSTRKVGLTMSPSQAKQLHTYKVRFWVHAGNRTHDSKLAKPKSQYSVPLDCMCWHRTCSFIKNTLFIASFGTKHCEIQT